MGPSSSSALQPEWVRKQIFEILHGHSDADMPLDAVHDDTPLLEDGLCLDSLDLLNAIIEIEEAVNLRLREEDMTEEVFTTAGSLADHVCARVSAGA